MRGPGSAADPLERLRFRSVQVAREGTRAEAAVDLDGPSGATTGRARGLATRHGLDRLVAAAALDAIGRSLRGAPAWDLVTVDRRRLSGRTAITVHLVLLRARRETHLVGSVFLGRDPFESVVLAVLDALNRVAGTLEPEDDLIEYQVSLYPWGGEAGPATEVREPVGP